MVRRLQRAGHQCVVFDRDSTAVQALTKEGATAAVSLPDFVSKLAAPRAVWLMLAAVADASITELAPVLTAALFSRFSSRGEADYADKLLSALRFEFGGHHEKR